MSQKYGWGLAKIEISPIAADGGIGNTWTQIGDTEQGTAVLTEEEGTSQDFFIEESDDPIFTANTQPGAKTFTFSTNNVNPDQLVLLKGGTVTGDGTMTPKKWEAPELEALVEKSLRLTTRTGQIIEVARAKFVANYEWNFGKENLARVNVVATILKPTKNLEKALTVTNPLPE